MTRLSAHPAETQRLISDLRRDVVRVVTDYVHAIGNGEPADRDEYRDALDLMLSVFATEIERRAIARCCPARDSFDDPIEEWPPAA
jgi:hypothetical protein